MTNFISRLLILSLLLTSSFIASPVEAAKNKKKKNKNEKELTMITKTESSSSSQAAAPTEEKPELVSIKINNRFEKDIKVMIGKGRIVTIPAREAAIVGNRPPGKHTFVIYNDDEEIIDTITKNVKDESGGKNKFTFQLNDHNVDDHEKIDGGLSTGKKVAIGVGAAGAAALVGSALLMNRGDEVPDLPDEAFDSYVPPQQVVVQEQVTANAPNLPSAPSINNAFAPGGKPIKFLNSKYETVTLIIEGTDGKPVGSNWVIGKGSYFDQPKHVLFNGQKVTVGDEQQISVITPDGKELSRHAFELSLDASDGSYVWALK